MIDIHIIVPLEWSYTRRLVLGVRSFCRKKPDWRLVWGGDFAGHANGRKAGAIALVRSPALIRRLRTAALPVVNVSGRLKDAKLPRVMPDQEAIGRAAAEHLLERRYRNFVFVGDPDERFSREREAGFHAAVSRPGCPCLSATPNTLVTALKRSPRPVGIMTYLDDIAPAVISACRATNLEIPREAAIVGVNNDDVFCELTDIPLSSVDPNAEHVGYEAAALLDRMLKGKRPPTSPVLVAPRGVVVRASSDYFALEDVDLAKAVQYIQEHACDPMTVTDVLPHINISRRTLEYRFREQFDRSLHDEIRRVQLEQAKRLLVRTDLTVPDVGERSGFAYVNRFSTLFRDAVGMPPGEYRKKFQRRA